MTVTGSALAQKAYVPRRSEKRDIALVPEWTFTGMILGPEEYRPRSYGSFGRTGFTDGNDFANRSRTETNRRSAARFCHSCASWSWS